MNQINVITNNFRKLSKDWAVYYIMDGLTAKVEFVGLCVLSQLFAAPDISSNPMFDQKFPDGHPVILQVSSIFKTKAEALKHQSELIRQYNLYKVMAQGRFMRTAPIICNETEEEFKTLAEAAARHGISASNLSNHLNHKPGFNTIRNKTYRRKV